MHHGLNFQNMYHLCRFIASLTLHSDLILSSYLPWPLKIDALMGLYWVQIMAAPPKLVTHLHIGKPSTFKYFSEVSEYKVMYWACYSGNWTAFSVKTKLPQESRGTKFTHIGSILTKFSNKALRSMRKNLNIQITIPE